ncbi:hypothetical protein GCM10022261_23490 [Brevibacterium daeguense]|uniref:Lipoprotein n=1 Tax=Brevibacterium daeguense TaxID=909936 RepID=A0ABP8ELI7_9MICO|nr:hypothetical protein [Brevibacterium daeguense]
MRIQLLPLAAVCATLALTGCQSSGSERPPAEPSVSPEVATPVATPDAAPAVTVVDTSPGGSADDDPLWQGLRQAAADGSEAYLHVAVHMYEEPVGGDTLTLTPSTPDSVSVTVPADSVSAEAAPFYRVTGTFSVEEVGSAAYTLESLTGEELSELHPQGPSSEERCTASDANERILQASQTLAEEPEQREELRLLWSSAPEVWWGIQRTAVSLRDTDGEVAGDFLTEACGAYLE